MPPSPVTGAHRCVRHSYGLPAPQVVPGGAWSHPTIAGGAVLGPYLGQAG